MNKNMKNYIAITGASGYVGINLLKYCIEKKINVKAFCRDVTKLNHLKSKYLDIYSYQLNKPMENLRGVYAIIHLAHQRFSGARRNQLDDINLIGTTQILKEVKKRNIKKVIYLSSILANKETISDYGKSKLCCEKLFKKSNFTIIKASFIFGGQPGGFYRDLVDNLSTKKVMPIVFPNVKIQPIHIEDLCIYMVKKLQKRSTDKKPIIFQHTEKISIKDFFCFLAAFLFNRKIIFFNLPSKLLLKLFYFLGYFNGFFNRIYERVSGLYSLEIISKENVIEVNESDLRKTNIFLSKYK